MSNIFKQKLGDTPQEAFNGTLGFSIFMFGLMGAACGLDEGPISGTVAQKFFFSEYGLEDLSLFQRVSQNNKGNGQNRKRALHGSPGVCDSTLEHSAYLRDHA
jgi:hypothetical protein